MLKTGFISKPRKPLTRRSFQWRSSNPLRRSKLITSTHSQVRESAEADASRRRLNHLGKKGREWIAVRRRLSAEFAARGIVSCELGYEGCWGEKALGWAHGRKRRHLKDRELESLVILSCNPCHSKIEYLPADEMLVIVESVIANRKRVA